MGIRWYRRLVMLGVAIMILGAVDPLEGSLIILVGVALVEVGSHLCHSRHRAVVNWSSALVAAGVAALWWLSALGGIGGNSGRSYWWALLLLPYPVGWILGLVAAIRILSEDVGQHPLVGFHSKGI